MESYYVNPREWALSSVVSYMQEGSTAPLGTLDHEMIKKWLTGARVAELPPDAANKVGWMHLEGAFSVIGNEADVLMSEAKSFWRPIITDRSYSVEFRTQAQLAIAATEIYRLWHRGESPTDEDLDAFNKVQFDVAAQLLKDYDKTRDPEILHSLHVHTFMSLLNSGAKDNRCIFLPLPPRFQDQGSEQSADVLAWLFTDGPIFNIQVSAMETPQEGKVSLSPAVLLNKEYPSRHGQGTLQALLDDHAGRRDKTGQRNEHLSRVVENVMEIFTAISVEHFSQPNIDPLDESQVAIDTYMNLEPSRLKLKKCEEVFDACMNPLENSVVSKKAKYDDYVALGWLHAENQIFTKRAGGFYRAVEMFERAALRAEREKDWRGYAEAMLARAFTACAARYEGDITEVDIQLQQDLAGMGELILWHVQEQKTSDESFRTGRLLYNITTALVLALDSDQIYMPFMASPRQHSLMSFDLLAAPHIDDTFRFTKAGRICFAAEQDPHLVNWGLAVITPETFDHVPRKVEEVLLAALDQARDKQDTEEAVTNRHAILQEARDRIFAAIETAIKL